MMYLHRFLRLTPVLMMTMLIQFTFVAKIGRGPFWAQMNYGIQDCADYWWSMLLYVQNYVNSKNMVIKLVKLVVLPKYLFLFLINSTQEFFLVASVDFCRICVSAVFMSTFAAISVR